MEIGNYYTERMRLETNIALVTIEAAFKAQKQQDADKAEEEAGRDFSRSEPGLAAAIILYRRAVLGSPKEFAIIRQIAERFYRKPASV